MVWINKLLQSLDTFKTRLCICSQKAVYSWVYLTWRHTVSMHIWLHDFWCILTLKLGQIQGWLEHHTSPFTDHWLVVLREHKKVHNVKSAWVLDTFCFQHVCFGVCAFKSGLTPSWTTRVFYVIWGEFPLISPHGKSLVLTPLLPSQ